MIQIRTKLLVFFIVLVIVMNSLAFFLYKSSETIINEYDSSFQRFLLLNEISQQTNQVVEQVNAYISEKESKYLVNLRSEKRKLIDHKDRLKKEIGNSNNYVALLNYEHMLESFLEESHLAVASFEENDINRYSKHFSEAAEISSFIQETTLALIDKELTSYQPYFDQLSARNLYYKLTALFLFSGTLIISTLLAMKLSRDITRPIKALSAAAKEISSGNFSGEDVAITSTDEFKLLTKTFNHMRKNILGLVNQMKEKSELDQLMKDLELKSLQNQINPHFLFNTLNNVSRMAYLEDAHETTKLVEAIAALLRYNLGNINKPSTIQEEVKVVEDYFFIQQTRFGDRIDFHIDIDQECHHFPIPRMTLQPIVENAFIHGVEASETDASITLTVKKAEERIIIQIVDDGEGMDAYTRDEILSYIRQSNTQEDQKVAQRGYAGHSTGIGVQNVIRRLQIFFKQQEVVDIQSEPKEGTIFTIFVPINHEERGDES